MQRRALLGPIDDLACEQMRDLLADLQTLSLVQQSVDLLFELLHGRQFIGEALAAEQQLVVAVLTRPLQQSPVSPRFDQAR